MQKTTIVDTAEDHLDEARNDLKNASNFYDAHVHDTDLLAEAFETIDTLMTAMKVLTERYEELKDALGEIEELKICCDCKQVVKCAFHDR